jgi:hypothetical protein
MKIGSTWINIQYWSVDGKYRIYFTRLRNGVKDELLASLSPRFAPSQINSIFTVNRPILYIYYFFKINTKISTSFRRSMLISFWIDAPGADPRGRAHPVRAPTLQLEKIWFFWRKIVIFHTKYLNNFYHIYYFTFKL